VAFDFSSFCIFFFFIFAVTFLLIHSHLLLSISEHRDGREMGTPHNAGLEGLRLEDFWRRLEDAGWVRMRTELVDLQ
jgi:hypothetical protein